MGMPFIIGASQQKKQRVLGFESFCSPLDFDRTAQPVDIYDVFERYYRTNTEAKYIYSFTSSIATLTLPALSGVSYRWGETISGVDYVYDVNSGTAFTAGSTKRYVIVKNTATSGAITLPTGTVWAYVGQYTATSISTVTSNSYLKYIHSNTLASIQSIAHRGFIMVGLTGVLTIPDGMTLTGDTQFYGDTLITQVNFGDSRTSLPVAFMYGCTGLTSLALPTNIVTIGDSAFANCSNITGTLNLPNSLTTIGNSAFQSDKKLTSISWGSSVNTIGASAFYNCSGLTGTFSIPNTITSIGNYAFRDCTGYTAQTLTIPSSVTSIGYGAFANDNFNAISNSASNFLVDKNGGDTDVLYDITGGSKYEAIYSAKAVTGTLIFRSDTTKILEFCSYNNSLKNNSTFIIPSTVTAIGQYAFYNCSGLTGGLTTPVNTTVIAPYAFSYCSGFTSLTVAGAVSTIETQVFSNMSNLTSVSLAEGVTTFNGRCFQGSPKLSAGLTLVLPTTTTTLNYPAFTNCNFIGITLNEGLTYIGADVFYYGGQFTGTLYIPSTVTTIVNGGCIGHGKWTAITGGSTNYPVSDNVLYDVTISGVIKVIGGAGEYVGTLTLRTDTTHINCQNTANSKYSNFTKRTGTLTLPSTLIDIVNYSFNGCTGINRVDSYPNTNPTVGTDGMLLGGTARDLHIPSGTSSYTGAPWTTATIFNQPPIKDL